MKLGFKTTTEPVKCFSGIWAENIENRDRITVAYDDPNTVPSSGKSAERETAMDTMENRREAICALVNERKNVTFAEIKEAFPQVSDMTIRTDLRVLDEKKADRAHSRWCQVGGNAACKWRRPRHPLRPQRRWEETDRAEGGQTHSTEHDDFCWFGKHNDTDVLYHPGYTVLYHDE